MEELVVDQAGNSLENVDLSKIEIKAFDMIAALLSTCVYKHNCICLCIAVVLIIYSSDYFISALHVHSELNFNSTNSTFSLLHMYRCWCSPYCRTDSPES